MSAVREYVRSAVHAVYELETPEALAREKVDVILGAAQFLDAETINVGERTIRANSFLLTTGAHAFIPPPLSTTSPR